MMKSSLWAALLLAGTAAFADEVQPVADWDFDRLEEGQTVSADGQYRAEIIRAELVTQVPGKCGSALRIGGRYRGNQAGALAVRNFKFDFTKPFTVEIMVKFDAGIGRKLRREIFSMTDGERGPGIRFSYHYDALFFSTGDGKEIRFVRTGAAFRMTPDVWHLLTVTYDGKKIVLYCDGTPEAEKELEIRPPQKVKALSIGSYKNALAYPLQGAIDDLKFYDFCKTPAQAAERYISIFGE